MTLVIVESPTKAKTISKFLGKEYTVTSSYGHVRDLPRGKLGVDVEGNFDPQYVIPTKVRKRVNEMKKEALDYETIILATDEDREGEAIAWHIAHILDEEVAKSKGPKSKKESKIKNIQRIVFHEITEEAIKDALAHPRVVDEKLVNAQQARRVLDRLVGYTLSPFLWKKIFRGLSAGRVQSVALRIIVVREKEREAFKADEYWFIEAQMQSEKKDATESFTASLNHADGEQLEKLSIKTEAAAKKIADDLESATYAVSKIEKKRTKRNPSAPFTTSTLQQQGYQRLHFGARQTMRSAQGLYEKGLITYMRTDSVNLSSQSLVAVTKWIKGTLGDSYVLEKPRVFKNKSKGAQEAHEAIRPTDPSRTPAAFGGTASIADSKEAKLYELIWQRFVASQLPQAEFDATAIHIKADGRKTYGLRASGNVMHFDGFLKVWPSKVTETILPELAEADPLTANEIVPEQHFTEPPPRYNEASLIKTLEEHGIGRPSTYAPTISTIQTRNYVEKDEQKRFVPTDTGLMVDSLIAEHFPQIVDIEFTARMEEDLDAVAEGSVEWRDLIRTFYEPFAKLVERKYDEVKKLEIPVEETDEVCDKCGKPMEVKIGRFGKFLGCTGFPDCKTAKQYVTDENSFGDCPDCSEGRVVARRTKTRRTFYGCSRYPDCEYATWKKPGGEEDSED